MEIKHEKKLSNLKNKIEPTDVITGVVIVWAILEVLEILITLQ